MLWHPRRNGPGRHATAFCNNAKGCPDGLDLTASKMPGCRSSRVTEPLASLLPQCPVAMPGSTSDRQLQTPQPPRPRRHQRRTGRSGNERIALSRSTERGGTESISAREREACSWALLCFRRLCVFCGEMLDSPQESWAGGAVGRARGASVAEAGSGGGSVNEGCRSQRWLHP